MTWFLSNISSMNNAKILIIKVVRWSLHFLSLHVSFYRYTFSRYPFPFIVTLSLVTRFLLSSHFLSFTFPFIVTLSHVTRFLLSLHFLSLHVSFYHYTFSRYTSHRYAFDNYTFLSSLWNLSHDSVYLNGISADDVHGYSWEILGNPWQDGFLFHRTDSFLLKILEFHQYCTYQIIVTWFPLNHFEAF